MNTKLIGLSGTNGAGKDSVGEMLAAYHGYMFISVTDLLRIECRKRGLPVERENLRMISAEWRREYGYGVLVERAIELYEPQKDKYQGLVMASMRNPYEADAIHEHGGTMVWVDGDPRVRYERIQANAHLRGRAEEDSKTFEQFLAEEDAEMHRPEGHDDATLNTAAVKDKSDIIIENDDNDLNKFRRQVETALGLPSA